MLDCGGLKYHLIQQRLTRRWAVSKSDADKLPDTTVKWMVRDCIPINKVENNCFSQVMKLTFHTFYKSLSRFIIITTIQQFYVEKKVLYVVIL